MQWGLFRLKVVLWHQLRCAKLSCSDALDPPLLRGNNNVQEQHQGRGDCKKDVGATADHYGSDNVREQQPEWSLSSLHNVDDRSHAGFRVRIMPANSK
jgi:hypothetical protein